MKKSGSFPFASKKMTPVKIRSGSAWEIGNQRKGKKTMRHFPTLAAAAIIAASALSSVPGMADETSDISAIEDIWQTYSASFAAGDAETWLSLWDEDGIQMPPGADARSFDILQAAVPDAFQESDVSAMHIYPEETTVTGDWAFPGAPTTLTKRWTASPCTSRASS